MRTVYHEVMQTESFKEAIKSNRCLMKSSHVSFLWLHEYHIAAFFKGENFQEFHETIAIYKNLPSKYFLQLLIKIVSN